MKPTFKESRLYRSLCISMLAGAAASAIPATATAQESTGGDATTLDRIQVTGSRIKRAEIEGALPITVIDREDIVSSGEVSVADYLRDTAFNTFGSFQSTSGNAALGTMQMNLRGLGANRTLILIDGRRAPTNPMSGQGQNLAAIPMAAVERIEILTDGASAIYGSDALGGVVNVITRKDYDGTEFSYGIGRPSNEGGDTEEFSVLFGTSGERGRILAGAAYNGRDIIMTRDRDYWTTPKGTSAYSNNFSTQRTNSLQPAGKLAHPDFGTAVPGDCTNGTNLFYMDGDTCHYDHTQSSGNLSSVENSSLFARGDYQINENWLAFTVADVTRVESNGIFAPVPSSPWPGGAIVLKAGSPNHPGTRPEDGGLNPDYDAYYAQFAGQDLYLFHRFAALGVRDNSVENTTYNLLGGFEGTVGKVDLEIGARYVESRAVNLGSNYVVGPLAQAVIDEGRYNIYDPFAGNPNALGFTHTVSRDMKTTSKEFFASASFDLFQLAGGTAAAVVSGEYRDEYYQDIYDPLAESGQVVGGAGNSAAGGRDVKAASFEMLMPFFDGFEVNVAGRYDRYSDYGSDFAPKVSMRWQPLDVLTVRASYGEGFRAPTLDILTQKTTFSAIQTTDSRTCQLLTGRPNCTTQVTTYTMANPNLESEQSEQWSLGAVWDVTDWLNVGLDHYNITINNQISNITLATVAACLRGEPGLCPSGLTQFAPGTVFPNESLGLGASFDPVTGGITGAQLGFVNLGTVKTEGYDFTARTNFEMADWGRLRNVLQVSYVSNFNVNDNPSVVGTLAGGVATPRIRGNLVNTWSFGNLDLNWNVSYIHGYDADGQTATETMPSWTTHNIQASYGLPWDATVTLGVNNVADKDPVYDPLKGGSSWIPALYDPWGRVPYIRYTQRF